MSKKDFVTDEGRWIGQLNELYWKIVTTPAISIGNLDKANKVICEAIEKLRPLARQTKTPLEALKEANKRNR